MGAGSPGRTPASGRASRCAALRWTREARSPASYRWVASDACS
ncbi:hypothetical protein [Streptomyces albidoflavus]|nr:hypothetical protein [Streptomyces albidoflavus]